MPFIIGQLRNLEYDMRGHKKTLDAALQTQMRQAARAWLRAVIPHVPVWTGMAASSLKPLGRYLNVAVPIKPRVTRSDKTPEKGRQQQHFEFENNGYVYTFRWTTEVLHYKLNEYFPSKLKLIHETPWNSTVHGDAAYRKYMRDVLPLRIPRAIDYISSSIITIRR